jgi:hypothetical protein
MPETKPAEVTLAISSPEPTAILGPQPATFTQPLLSQERKEMLDYGGILQKVAL